MSDWNIETLIVREPVQDGLRAAFNAYQACKKICDRIGAPADSELRNYWLDASKVQEIISREWSSFPFSA